MDLPIPARTSGFGRQHLPYGVFTVADGRPRVGARLGDRVLDLEALLGDAVFSRPSLNAFMALGPGAWADARGRLQGLLAGAAVPLTAHFAVSEVALSLPFEVADYVDFYSSRSHAENLGKILRPGTEPLSPNWLHMPIGYHGRAGTVVVSGAAVRRPSGQRLAPGATVPTFGPSTRLDIEAEVGFVIGTPSERGIPVEIDQALDHVFGVVLLNDWSARDIQAWEYTPLGPFLGKSFATSISAWVTPMAALAEASTRAPVQEPPPLPYLVGRDARRGLDLRLEVSINGTVVSKPPFAGVYWTLAQQVAHLTVNGANLRTGDLLGSGTVSGDDPREFGSLVEMSWNGSRAVPLGDGTERGFLLDGDEVSIRAAAPGLEGTTITLGEVRGVIQPG